MSEKLIQEQIGQRAIEAFAEFARADLDSPDTLATSQFAHVTDAKLRQALAQVLYGARWIYKLGLVTLAKNEERAAHVRAQIVDYASICEALLSYLIGCAIDHNHTKGTAHHWTNPDERVAAKKKSIRWGTISTEAMLRKQTLWWYARIAREFTIVNRGLYDDLGWIREQRNAVHVRQRVTVGAGAYLNESKKAYNVLHECIRQTRVWSASHP